MPNIYRRFLDLIPDSPLQVGNVIAVGSFGCTVELPGGGLLQVRGTAVVGDQVFVKDGVIEATAPTLPIVLIEI